MRKIPALLTVFILLAMSVGYAEEDNYMANLTDLVDQTRDLESVTKAGSVDKDPLERWHGNFLAKYERFEKEFTASHKMSRSFRLVREGANGFSEALGILKQAEYAHEQYTESITSSQVDYAHKWKKQESEDKKKAYDSVVKAVDTLKSALNAASSE